MGGTTKLCLKAGRNRIEFMTDNPPAESAAATGSAPVYRFSTFQELLDRVPSNRICDCLDEIGKMLSASKAMMELHFHVMCEMMKKDGLPEPQMSESLLKLPKEIEWIDDGKGNLRATIPFTDKDGLEIRIGRQNTGVEGRQSPPTAG